MEASPTLRQPLRLSCLKKPPQRFEIFSTTLPWETQGQRERDTVIWLCPQDRGSAVTSKLAPKPTDPALSLGLDNATQHAHCCSTCCIGKHTQKNFTHASPLCLSGSWTSRFSASCCHLGPGHSTPDRITDRLWREATLSLFFTDVERKL